jgi:hypothetical protein
MWHEGTIGIPLKNGKRQIAHYWVKAYERGSKYGINGGRISKLTIKIDGETVANYDRGWDIRPEDNGDAAIVAYCILLKDYN